MIRIRKRQTGPKILSGANNRGPRRTTDMRNAYDAGKRDFKFDSSIYGARSVKNALLGAQHDKCCFCESKFTHVAYGDVEHFRPKGGWVQNDGDPLGQPGYYWLAYDWSNLFACCQICNQRHKRNMFPLKNPADRALSHNHDVARERPQFIQPGDEDPEAFIGFRAEVPFAINDDNRADTTITELGLRRDPLTNMRAQSLELPLLAARTLRSYRERDAGIGPPLTPAERDTMADIEQTLASLMRPEMQYSSMMKWALQDVVLPDGQGSDT